MTGGDGLGLCQGPCQPGEPRDGGGGRREGGRGAAQSQDQQHVDKGLSRLVCFIKELRSHGWPRRGVANGRGGARSHSLMACEGRAAEEHRWLLLKEK